MLVNGVSGNLISIRDRGLLYGDGVFRTLRASHGTALHWSLHYQKLLHDCTALGIACPELDVLSAELHGLLKHHPDGAVKLIVTRGQGARGYAPPDPSMPTHLWDITPLPVYPANNAIQGIKARLCELRLSEQPRLAGIKHLNRLENVLAAAEWNDAEIAEGIMLDGAGRVIEGMRSNVFCVVQGKLVTPDLSRCGVAGVQRERVIAWAMQQGIAVQVRDVGLDELLQAEEVFAVNSMIGLWPLRELAQRSWSHFPIATQIRHDLAGQET